MEEILGIIGSIKSAVTSAVTSIVSEIKAVTSVFVDLVGALRPYEIQLFNRAIADTKAVLGEILLPVFEEMIGWVRQFADYLYNLPDPIKNIIKWVGEFAAHFGLLGLILDRVNQSASGSRLIQNVISTIESVIVTIIGLGQVVADHLQPIWEDLKAALSTTADLLNDRLNMLKPIIGLVLVTAAQMAADALSKFIQSLIAVVNAVNWTIRQMNRILRELGVSIKQFNLPEIKKTNASSFGKAAFGETGLTTTIEIFRTIQNNLLKATGTEADKPVSPKHLTPIEELLKKNLTENEKHTTFFEFMVQVARGAGMGGIAQIGKGLIMGD